MGLRGSLPHSQQSATCPYPQPDQSNPRPHPITLNIILLLLLLFSFHPRLRLPSVLLPSNFPIKPLDVPLISPTRNWTYSPILGTTQRKTHKKVTPRGIQTACTTFHICISFIYRFPVHVCSVCTPCNVPVQSSSKARETATGYPPGSWFTESSWCTTLLMWWRRKETCLGGTQQRSHCSMLR